jgi:glycosyltransferase involved in cell wall biosynthesis
MPARVLHVMDHLGAGGIQTGALNLLGHWSDRGFTHHIAALHGAGPLHARFVELGAEPCYAARRKASPMLLPGLRRIVREVQPDIVHAYGVPSSLLCESFRGWLGIPRLVCHIQSTYRAHDGQPYQNHLEHLCYRRCDHLIACSRAAMEGLKRSVPITVIPNGIDTARFSRGLSPRERTALRAGMGFGEQDFIIGTSGRLVEGKDPWTLLHAFAALAPEHPGWRLLFVGGGPLEPSMRQWVEEKGLAGRVHITGFVSPPEVPRLLHAMDLFAFPSLREGSPLALAEAMAAGLPCVCADFPAAHEVLRHGVEGLVFPRRDSPALAEAIAQLAESPEERGRMTAAGAKRVLEEFSIAAMTARLARVYSALYAHGPAAAQGN